MRAKMSIQALVHVGRATSDDDSILEIRGRAIKSGRECTRDADWELLRLSVTSQQFGRHTILVGKSGGDAAKLRPLQVHGTEEVDLKPHLTGVAASCNLEFDCETLLVRPHDTSCLACCPTGSNRLHYNLKVELQVRHEDASLKNG